MTMKNKEKIAALLKSIETGDTRATAYVNEDKYIQHNPQTHEGNAGLAALFKRLSKTNPRVNTVRSFEDEDFVFAHMEYDFVSRRIGFEIFRFENGQAVEHWDNIQERLGPNIAGHSMIDGQTEVADLDFTESNRAKANEFIEAVMLGKNYDRLTDFINQDNFIDHSPKMPGTLEGLSIALEAGIAGDHHIDYQKLHKVLAEGNFVLCVCEGKYHGKHSAFFDLFRMDQGKIVEHWDTTETIAPRSEWKNQNGKFGNMS